MEFSLGSKEDIFHNLQQQGSYEWWYFDGISTDSKYSFVFIFFVGIPMSPTYLESIQNDSTPIPSFQNCGISFNLYHKNKRIYTAFQEGLGTNSDYSSSCCEGRFGKNSFSYQQDKNAFCLSLDTELHDSTTWIKGTVELIPHLNMKNTSVQYWKHLWNLVAPRTSFSASIDIIEYNSTVLTTSFKGIGYHDHNCGVEPLYKHFSQWYWGNIHSEKQTIVFYDVHAFQDRNSEAVVTLSDDNNFEVLKVIDVSYSDYRLSLMGIWYATRYTFHCENSKNESIIIKIRKIRIKEQGPFYLRFAISAELYCSGKKLNEFKGISEYMEAQRLSKPWIRPFLRVPLKQAVHIL